MPAFGRNVASLVTGKIIEVSADGKPIPKAGGVTIDWDTVTAVSADTTLPDGLVVPNGKKYLRYGQVITMIGVAEVETVIISGTPTAGTFTLTLPASGGAPAQTTAALAFNATAQAVTDALNALSRIGPNGVTVVQTGTTPNFTNTITFARRLGDVPQLTSTDSTTGGTHAIAHATTTSGATTNETSGAFGPYDPSASDGRQTLNRGDVYILNENALEKGLLGTFLPNGDNPQALEGGLLWRERVLATKMATGTLALGPTFTNLEAAMPLVQWISTN